ncbi:MAG: deoxyribodipyrimidine photo-lyase [Bacteroidales bacterium]|nr:deoxyribodipyrimidine photo-lyase [Bacteroidales bacterium]
MINIFWFRRDLRLDDNTALIHALRSGLPVIPVFIFDTNIINELPRDDARISFIYSLLSIINDKIKGSGSSLLVLKGDPLMTWEKLTASYDISSVYINKDYEPYAIQRDNALEELLKKKGISLLRFKDQVIFEEKEILKSDDKPYTVFTPYKKVWLQKMEKVLPAKTDKRKPGFKNFQPFVNNFPSMKELGFENSRIRVKPYDLSVVKEYDKYRDIPSADRTSYLSPHLRFGTVSIRKIVSIALEENIVFLNELIWREFFMQILFHFPDVVTDNFKNVYDDVQWRNNEKEFNLWCRGETGYPIVDAGMRQLNETGYMHNRVRMITAGFLCKHLLIDWRLGEGYFAQKLLDYELSSNNGNWQWAAGTGCDAAPYFRIFNPETQQKKFDLRKEYISRWVPEYGKAAYPDKIVDHDFARKRAIEVYKSGLRKKSSSFR